MLTLDEDLLHDSHNEHDLHDMQPEIVQLPGQKMAVIHTIGDPDQCMHLVLPPLYSSVYRLKYERRKEGKDFKLDHFRARWLNAEFAPMEELHSIWGLPIPEDTSSLPQRFPHVEVEIEMWEYGTIAQLTYRGPGLSIGRARRLQAMECLKDFVSRNGYESTGLFEEEYLMGPEPEIQRTRLQFLVKMQPIIMPHSRVPGHISIIY